MPVVGAVGFRRLFDALTDPAPLDHEIMIVPLAVDFDLAECLHAHLHQCHS